MSYASNQEIEGNSYDNALDGQLPIVTRNITVASGENLAKYTVVALNSSNKIVAYDSDAASPENVPYAVLMEAVDATGGDAPGVIYVNAAIREDALVFVGSADTVTQTVYDALRTRGIFVINQYPG